MRYNVLLVSRISIRSGTGQTLALVWFRGLHLWCQRHFLYAVYLWIIKVKLLYIAVILKFWAFERAIDKEDRNVVQLRWEILVMTPLEDVVKFISTSKYGIYLLRFTQSLESICSNMVSPTLSHICALFSLLEWW